MTRGRGLRESQYLAGRVSCWHQEPVELETQADRFSQTDKSQLVGFLLRYQRS